jgi:hypothetical protein
MLRTRVWCGWHWHASQATPPRAAWRRRISAVQGCSRWLVSGHLCRLSRGFGHALHYQPRALARARTLRPEWRAPNGTTYTRTQVHMLGVRLCPRRDRARATRGCRALDLCQVAVCRHGRRAATNTRRPSVRQRDHTESARAVMPLRCLLDLLGRSLWALRSAYSSKSGRPGPASGE